MAAKATRPFRSRRRHSTPMLLMCRDDANKVSTQRICFVAFGSASGWRRLEPGTFKGSFEFQTSHNPQPLCLRLETVCWMSIVCGKVSRSKAN